MEEKVEKLAQKVWAQYMKRSPSKRLLIAISGIPGSGKTSLASELVARLNRMHDDHYPAADGRPSILVSMDGYHLSRAQLSAMPDPDTAHARRGAAFTFDARAFLQLVRAMREPLSPQTRTLYAPSFDHAIKDPVQDDIEITPRAVIVIFEGNYLSLNQGDWQLAAELMDELWFVQVETAVARERLVMRHVKAGIAKDPAEAARRVDENDLVNGQQIIDGKLDAQEVIQSVEDEAWLARA